MPGSEPSEPGPTESAPPPPAVPTVPPGPPVPPPITGPGELPLPPPPPTVSSITAPIVTGLPAAVPTRGGLIKYGFTITESEDYTDNFRLTAKNRESNLRSALSPGVVLAVDRPYAKGNLSYTLSAIHDLATGEFRVGQSSGQALNLGTTWQPTERWSLSVNDVLTRSDEQALADRLGLRQERQDYSSNALNLGAGYRYQNVGAQGYYRLTTFLGGSGGGGNTISHAFGLTPTFTLLPPNSGSLNYEYLQSDTPSTSRVSGHRVTATFGRELTSLTSVGITGSYAIRDVESEPVVRGAPTTTSRYNQWTVSVYNTRTISGSLSMRGNIGITGFDTGAGRQDVSVSSESALSYRFPRGSLTLAYSQGFSETFAEGQNFGVVKTQAIDGSFGYPITPLIGASVSAFYRDNEFTGVAGGQAGLKQSNWGGRMSVSSRIRWLSVLLDYDYTQVTANVAGGGYVQNRFRLSLGTNF